MATSSKMMLLGSLLPEFELPDYDGTMVASDRFQDRPLLVVFLSNTCPVVAHIIDKLADKARDYQALGVGVVAISSNDAAQQPEADPEHMKSFAQEHVLSVPYLYDETQHVALSFKAACTPDFFFYDRTHRLVYRGQFDDSRPGNDAPVTGADLTAAINDIVSGNDVQSRQLPSFGCAIVWKEENLPVVLAAYTGVSKPRP